MFSRKRGDEPDGSVAGRSTGGSLTLAHLGQGQACEVVDVVGEDAVTARLLEMGVIPGTEVLVIGSAMGGDPIELSVRNYRLTVRRSEAERVIVQPASGGSDGD
jgi:ferrous iron transport protein A